MKSNFWNLLDSERSSFLYCDYDTELPNLLASPGITFCISLNSITLGSAIKSLQEENKES